jgi:hypothetical protein
MAIYTEVPVIDAASQQLSTSLGVARFDLSLDFNEFSGRWSLGIAVDGVVLERGRRVVLGANLFESIGSEYGELRAVDWAGTGAQPGRTELPSGAVRLIHRAAA